MTRTVILKPERFDKICRVCLSDVEGGCFISVFKTYLGDKIVKDVLQSCTSVKVSDQQTTTKKLIVYLQIEETDHLPSHLCNGCLIKLINWNMFVEQCQESDGLLKSVANSAEGLPDVKSIGEGTVEITVATNEYSDFSDDDNQGDVGVTPKEEDEGENDVKKRPRSDFRCRQCDLVFNSVDERQVHEKETNHKVRVKNKICSFCGKAFANRDHLNRHVRTHTKEKPYQCTSCEMRFSMVQNLRRHEKLHTGERPYKCDDCGKGMKFSCFCNIF